MSSCTPIAVVCMGSLGHCGSAHLAKAEMSGWIEVMSQTVGQREKAIKGRLRKISTGRFAPGCLKGCTRHTHSPRLQTPHSSLERTISHIIQQIPHLLPYRIISYLPTYIKCCCIFSAFITQPSWRFYTSLHVWSVAKLSNLFSNHCFTTRLMPLTVCCYSSPAYVKWVTLFR